jgi:hypothetical protein
MIAVSSLLIFSFMAYAEAIRFSSEARQLKNLLDHVVGKSTELVTLTLATNATAESFLQMPTSIGNRQYWLGLHNDSKSSWIEGGFGNIALEGTDLRVYLPKEATATGSYVSAHGAAHLSCNFSAGVPQLRLENSNEGN